MKFIFALLMCLAVLPAHAAPTVHPKNTGCAANLQKPNQIDCELIANDTPIGIGVAPGTYAAFTNNTGTYLQINRVEAYTGERQFWAEYCVMTALVIGQSAAGVGEIGCAAKSIGEDYPPVTFGNGTGYSVAPGQTIYLNSSTQPNHVNHTYSMWVSPQTTGLYSWRQPQMDGIIPCNGQTQASHWAPWRNDTGRTLRVEGAYIYAESGNAWAKNTASNAACVYIYGANGAQRYANCDDALRTRGEVPLPTTLTVAPGEFIAAQATNACPSGAVWDWAAFIHVW